MFLFFCIIEALQLLVLKMSSSVSSERKGWGGMKKKSAQTVVTEISDASSMTLNLAENSGTELAVLRLTVFVVLNML